MEQCLYVLCLHVLYVLSLSLSSSFFPGGKRNTDVDSDKEEEEGEVVLEVFPK